MSLFGIFHKTDNKNKDNHEAEHAAVRDIAGKISCDDVLVMGEIEELLKDAGGYFELHKDCFEERGICSFDSNPINEIYWLGMVDILSEHGYVCERDYSDELEDFIYFLRGLKGVSKEKLPVEAEKFDVEGFIGDWCEALDAEWESLGCFVGCIDIESDSYVLFPAKTEELEELNRLAEQLGKRIGHANDF